MAPALTDRTTLALLLIDVDCFKPFNDNYGHVVGDQCLRRVAEVLARGARRAGETIARYGGDEFAILLPRTDPERASALARHLCKSARDLGMPHAHSDVAPHVTISIGLASISMGQQTEQFASTLLVEAADHASMPPRRQAATALPKTWLRPVAGLSRSVMGASPARRFRGPSGRRVISASRFGSGDRRSVRRAKSGRGLVAKMPPASRMILQGAWVRPAGIRGWG